MKRLILLLLVVVVLAMPVLAEAHRSVVRDRFGVQGTFYWHPFFYPGPFAYGYPRGFTYGYPGPDVSYDDASCYTYGYPGPYSYGTWEYSRPHCVLKPDGMWLCS
jgi:hypothetical protein